MQAILHDVDPRFGLDASTAPEGSAPAVTWEENRGEALDQLAASINGIWQPDRVGSFVLYPNPYRLATPPEIPVLLFDGPGGNLTQHTELRTRSSVRNSITVVVERAENAPPLRVTVRDERAGSKTRWGGKFGKSNQVLRLQTTDSAGEAVSVAQRMLNQSLALGRSWRITTPHFPLLDPGDVSGVRYQGEVTARVVESITYPLAAINATSVSMRELRYQTEGEL
jgi:hypothetical protein